MRDDIREALADLAAHLEGDDGTYGTLAVPLSSNQEWIAAVEQLAEIAEKHGAEQTPPPRKPVSTDMFTFPRIKVDSSDFAAIHEMANSAVDTWWLTTDHVFKTHADAVHAIVKEALLHLLELGFIDIDTERFKTMPSVPMSRSEGRA